jgi:hypothetical protein
MEIQSELHKHEQKTNDRFKMKYILLVYTVQSLNFLSTCSLCVALSFRSQVFLFKSESQNVTNVHISLGYIIVIEFPLISKT